MTSLEERLSVGCGKARLVPQRSIHHENTLRQSIDVCAKQEHVRIQSGSLGRTKGTKGHAGAGLAQWRTRGRNSSDSEKVPVKGAGASQTPPLAHAAVSVKRQRWFSSPATHGTHIG